MSYWENQIHLIKKMSTQELGRKIVKFSEFIEEYKPDESFGEIENYLAHLKCEYAEIIGKHK